ncbi:GNAT family N-acetyltransferase [Epilithonimonas arachidiradicis]|uniref:N-acetyltransferase n=1 Tax=Epilithonimonas arachidiradicis TaxID=1617282 RepID=A0A420D834_9FLAO|nr:GNAT family N-acetyltransferase [Epilithonimonas arachidiradicis]RKE86868.1 ribosomal protein S18 acetylase RimI-like enzyme [Epilithonimonas arachidiradicis]GGG61446.1 N-acetyltransferase [Epilithonimonas arachidiradicis]
MIIKAEPNDISIIQDLAKKSWSFAYADILEQDQIDYMLNMMYSEETLKKHFENPHYQYYLIQEENQFLGFVGFEFHHEPQTTKLHRIYFLKEAQGKGLGKKALNFVSNEAEKMGDKRVSLTVNKNNSARKFYESQGFQIYDEAIFDIGNGYVMDDYLMEFLLK